MAIDEFSEFDRMLEDARRRSDSPSSVSSSGGVAEIATSTPTPLHLAPLSPIVIPVGGTISGEFAALRLDSDEEEEEENEFDEEGSIFLEDKGEYFNPSLPYKPEFLNDNFKKLGEICEQVYPGNWCVADDDFYIRFPEITITNSRKKTHIIRDLFVRFSIRPDDGTFLVGLYGCRGQLTRAEIYSDYGHSHLSGLSGGNFDGFCLGSDYIIDIMHSIRSFKDPLYFKKFEGFLYQLGEYVRYESIEGRPYRYIRNIGFRSRRENQSSSVIASAVNDIKVHFRGYKYYPDFSLDSDFGVTIINTEEYERLLFEATEHRGVYQMKDRFGFFFTPGQNADQNDASGADAYIQNCSKIYFRGQFFKPKLYIENENETQAIEKSTEKFCHRDFKDAFERQLKFKIIKQWAYLSEGILQRDFEQHRERRKNKDLKRFSPKSVQVVSTDLGD
jgi:hypothetical protein